jgi:hypothetical protein
VAAVPLAFGGLVSYAYYGISHPEKSEQPLPEGLIALGSPEGQALAASARAAADLDALQAAFQQQEKQTWCGVASSATVLSAMKGEEVAQDEFFTPATSEIRSWTRITFTGMTLPHLGAMLATHGVSVEVHHADEGLDAFREQAVANLSRPGDYVLINYKREPLGQGGTGHISPLGAYDAGSDRFLVLDVASYKWPPVWVEAEALFSAMDTVDSESEKKRGWVLVTPG